MIAMLDDENVETTFDTHHRYNDCTIQPMQKPMLSSWLAVELLVDIFCFHFQTRYGALVTLYSRYRSGSEILSPLYSSNK